MCGVCGWCVSHDQSIQSADARQKALNEELERTRGLLTQEIESLRQGFQQQVAITHFGGRGCVVT